MIYIPNFGCLFFLILLLLVGGSPLLLGLARLALFGFALIFIAAGVASWWFRRHAVNLYTRSQTLDHNTFVEALVGLLVRLAEVDGELDRREVTAIRTFFQQNLGYSGEKLLWIRDLIQEARGSTTSVAELCDRVVGTFDLQARFIVMEILGRVAVADGVVDQREQAFLDEVAQRLGLAPFLRGFGWHQGGGFHQGRQAGPSAEDRVSAALAALGLEPGASADEIKQTWRRLSKEHHPDRVTHLGEEFRQVAEERMRKINAAYDELKQAGLVS